MSSVPSVVEMQRPAPGIIYGLTHGLDGTPIIREPRILKVGIGCPKGPAVDVHIKDGKWWVRTGYQKGKATNFPCRDRAHAEARYAELKPQADTCPYPRKLDYFTFTRQTADGSFEPDFEAIEAHGEHPNSIDLVFFDDNPLDASYQYWGSSELKCKGDGINAERVLAMAATEDEKTLAAMAKGDGARYFPVIQGCCLRGCLHAQESTRGNKVQPAACKPHADLKFQLARNLRIGGTAYFSTTGRRSISQLFSSLYRFRTVTGGGDAARGFLTGIPFKMVLKPFRTNHNGQPGTAYGVSLEFRAETVEDLLKNMVEQGMKFRRSMSVGLPAASQVTAPTVRLLEAGESPAEVVDPGEEALAARAVNDEFSAEGIVEDDGEDIPDGVYQGTRADQQAVAERKLAEFRSETPEEREARVVRKMEQQDEEHRQQQAKQQPDAPEHTAEEAGQLPGADTGNPPPARQRPVFGGRARS